MLAILTLIPSASAYELGGWWLDEDTQYELSINAGSTWNPELEDAADAWNDVYGALNMLGTDESNQAACDHEDGDNAVEFYTWSSSSCVNSTSSSTLAVTISTYWTDNMEVFDTDVLFNSNHSWTTSYSTAYAGSAYYFLGVAQHEFGHVQGFDHEDDVATCMNTYYSLASAELHADDMAAHRDLYDSGNTQTNLAASAWEAPTSSAATEIDCTTSAESGGTVEYEFVMENRGTEYISGAGVRMYLSTNSTISTADEKVAGWSLNITGGSHYEIDDDGDVPDDLEEGYYYLGVVTDWDGLISESDETDNTAVCPDRVWIDCPDEDSDGYDAQICGGLDCDDSDDDRSPSDSETCDGVDNDCDGDVDEGVKTRFYEDEDDDGYGTSSYIEACSPTGDYTATRDGDCDDDDRDVNPGEAEVCNDVDDDCDGGIDENLDRTWYRDEDGDGYGSSFTREDCEAYGSYTATRDGDCDDDDDDVNPGETEVCNGIDDDCDGAEDEGLDETWYRDADGDGWGSSERIEACAPEGEFTADEDGDCDDLDADVNPGEEEICDDIDNDCDGDVDGETCEQDQGGGLGGGRKSKGCSVAPAPLSLMGLLLALGGLRRRRR